MKKSRVTKSLSTKSDKSNKSKSKKEISLEDLFVLNIVLFSVVAILHFSRIVLRTPVMTGSFELPMWLSGLGLIVLIFLIWQNWIRTEKSKKTCAKILIGIFVVDFLGILGAIYYQVPFLGFEGVDYTIFALVDLLIIGGLFWYIKKK